MSHPLVIRYPKHARRTLRKRRPWLKLLGVFALSFFTFSVIAAIGVAINLFVYVAALLAR